MVLRRKVSSPWRARPSAAYSPVPVDEAPPVPDPEVLLLVEQGRKITAIKRYREQNPGIGLKQAKDVIDALQPG
jgi:ribosomal protein L7/L12